MASIYLSFLGAAGNVTGAQYLIETENSKVLIDCGMFQERDLRYRNWESFQFDPQSLDAVILTHAHLDHCGLLPRLVNSGFKGNIFATSPTCDIVAVVLLDAARLQEEDAINKKRRHKKEGRTGPFPEIPLYTVEDVGRVLPMLRPVNYDTFTPVTDDIFVTWRHAGHILGSSILEINISDTVIVFSGDLGRLDSPLLRDPWKVRYADFIVVESTYGNRLHEISDRIDEVLVDSINYAVSNGGNVVIPSFAIERAQELLYRLNKLLLLDRIPHIPVFLDSPMAIKVNEVFKKYPDLLDDEALLLIHNGKLPCDFPSLHIVRSVDESKALNYIKGTSIIIAGSGMCTGGRIKYHLARNITRSESVIVFVGYQARGTLGREILDGISPVRIHGVYYDVKARIVKIEGLSAHADRNELLEWLADCNSVKNVFVVHGEVEASTALAGLIEKSKGFACKIPIWKERVCLEEG